jgi:hypothetical protein
MNYAAVNLSFRGFGEAESAYRKALKLRPDDYEAHLGLALAIRGQISESNWDKGVSEAQQHLDKCKKLAPERPETYYNEAILTHEFRAKKGKATDALEKAAKQSREFIGKAGGDSTFSEAVKRSKDRIQDIEDTVKFIQEGEIAAKEQAKMDAANKQKAEADKKQAEADKKQAEADKKKAEADKKAAEAVKKDDKKK